MIIIDREGIEGYNNVRSDLHECQSSWTKSTSQTSQGCGNLVPASPHTALGETSFCAPRVDAERASSVGICLAK